MQRPEKTGGLKTKVEKVVKTDLLVRKEVHKEKTGAQGPGRKTEPGATIETQGRITGHKEKTGHLDLSRKTKRHQQRAGRNKSQLLLPTPPEKTGGRAEKTGHRGPINKAVVLLQMPALHRMFPQCQITVVRKVLRLKTLKRKSFLTETKRTIILHNAI